MKTDAIIFDIDGTLAKMGDRSPFDWKKVGLDTPHQDIIDLMNVFVGDEYSNWTILVVTGRLEVCEKETKDWLKQYNVPYHKLFMRKTDEEFDKDVIIKARIYNEEIEPKHNVHYVFDDRDQTVAGWRNLGLRCLQVAPGNF